MPRILPLLVAAAGLGLAAQNGKPAEAPWKDKASLSLVSLGGNAQGQTLGFANEYKYTWTHAALAINAGGVRVSSTTTTHAAVGTGTAPDQYTVTESHKTATAAESYFANARYDHRFTERVFWYGGLGWDRNLPAGIRNRSVANAGAGYWWVNTQVCKFRSDLGAGYTRITQVFPTPSFQDRFGTWKLALSLEQKAGVTGLFSSNLQATCNATSSQAYLAEWKNAFTTNLNRRLALKVGYDLTYNNAPAFQGVDILLAGAVPPVVLGQAPVPLKKLDTVFTTSLVITL